MPVDRWKFYSEDGEWVKLEDHEAEVECLRDRLMLCEAALVDEYSSSSSERTTSYLSKYPIPADPSGVRGGTQRRELP